MRKRCRRFWGRPPQSLESRQQPHAAPAVQARRYRVAIFGSARAQPGTFVYDEVKRAAAAFAAMGCDIVTGGGPA